MTLTLGIPRAQVLLASGPAGPDATDFELTADGRLGDPRHLVEPVPRPGLPDPQLPDPRHGQRTTGPGRTRRKGCCRSPDGTSFQPHRPQHPDEDRPPEPNPLARPPGRPPGPDRRAATSASDRCGRWEESSDLVDGAASTTQSRRRSVSAPAIAELRRQAAKRHLDDAIVAPLKERMREPVGQAHRPLHHLDGPPDRDRGAARASAASRDARPLRGHRAPRRRASTCSNAPHDVDAYPHPVGKWRSHDAVEHRPLCAARLPPGGTPATSPTIRRTCRLSRSRPRAPRE